MNTQLAEKYRSESGTPSVDGLTGLYNHGFFQCLIEHEIQRSERFGDPFSLALIDIDAFTRYNRIHGYANGDHILNEIAEVIKSNLRQIDIAFRYAGDIFAIILVNTDFQQSRTPIERVKEAIYDRFGKNPTVSIGLASFPAHGRTKFSLIRSAFKALTQAKIQGKNRIFFFSSESQHTNASPPRVMLVDDSRDNLELLEALIKPLNCRTVKATSGEDALHFMDTLDIDLILLDVLMPEMNGFEVCRRIKGNEATRLIPIILLTGLDDIESKIKGIEAGADDFITKPFNSMELMARTKSLISHKKLNNNLTSIENVLFSFAQAVEAKDAYTQGHVERVSNMAVHLARRMALTPVEQEALRFGGILHDIGKIGIPDNILNKPGKLDSDEWRLIQNHPGAGYQICLPLQQTLGDALDVIRHHHEKLDGSGYPDGLEKDEISNVARVMAAADIWDALITTRSYRQKMPKEKAMQILMEEVRQGKLDGTVVDHLAAAISS